MHHLVLSVLVLASTNSIEGRSLRQRVSVVQGTQIRQLDNQNGASSESTPITKSDQNNVMVRPPNLAQGDTGAPLHDPSPDEPLGSNGSDSTISEPTVAFSESPVAPMTGDNAPVSLLSDQPIAPIMVPTTVFAPAIAPSPSSEGPWSPASTPTEYQSHLPSDIPSDLPSTIQSPSPTRLQTTLATMYPTNMPSSLSTDFLTWEPSPYLTQGSWPSPSEDPTREPSRKPTDTPSIMSSVYPSASAVPTGSAFVTISIDENGNPTGDGNGGNSLDQNGGLNGGGVALLSECADQTANETGASTNVLEFQYVMILKPSISADSVVMEIEPMLHRQIGVEFLTCDNQKQRKLQQASNDDKPFTFINLSSLPMDKIASSACDDDDKQSSDDGFNCFVVDAGFTSKMVFSASPEKVLQTIASFLTELMASERWHDANQNIHRLSFRGFQDDMVNVATAPPTGNENNPNGAVSMTSPADVGAIVGGTLAVVVAALAALLVLFFAAKRRRQVKLYNKPVDEGFLDEGSDPTLPEEGVPSFIVVQDDESKASSGYGTTAKVVASYRESMAAWGHDSRTCKSTTCAECQADKLLVPTFVPADVMTAQIKRDLAPARPPRPRPGFVPNDTVVL